MVNPFILRAKHRRYKSRVRSVVTAPKVRIPLTQNDLQVRPAAYLITHLHLARLWGRGLIEELQWFVQSMRGELPPHRVQHKNYRIHHIFIHNEKQYLMALEALTTRLGVRL